MIDVLEVYLAKTLVGRLTLLTGDRAFFAFEADYLNDLNRPVLSQSFLKASGDILPETKITQTKLPPYFSNLLPEGHLRSYLAHRGGINPAREFRLIALLGADLPGAVIVTEPGMPLEAMAVRQDHTENKRKTVAEEPYRFSLAGVQLKFSALAESTGGLTIPANGAGGDWIIKLPAQNFVQVPENEWAMLHLASQIGIPVPQVRLVSLDKIGGLPDLGVLSGTQALVVKRFDRGDFSKGASRQRIHIEDFAQVYHLFPADKYSKVSYANIANMVWTLTGEQGLVDFIQRLTFTILIGNGDMHLKNWSFIYADGRTPQLSPAYDFVSTIPYIPNDSLALSLSGTKNMRAVTLEHFKKLTKKARLPEHIVLNTVRGTVAATRQAWDADHKHYELSGEIQKRIELHMKSVFPDVSSVSFSYTSV